MIHNQEYQKLKENNFSIETDIIFKILIIVWNLILLQIVLPNLPYNKHDYILFTIIIFLIPLFTILAVLIPNAIFKMTIGIILTIIGAFACPLTIVLIVVLLNGSKTVYWEYILLMFIFQLIVSLGILFSGIFLIYEANSITKKYYFKTSAMQGRKKKEVSINAVDAFEALV